MAHRQVLLVGGPLDKHVHELHGAIMPDEIGLPGSGKVVVNSGELHWYAVRDGKGYFLRTEKRAYNG